MSFASLLPLALVLVGHGVPESQKEPSSPYLAGSLPTASRGGTAYAVLPGRLALGPTVEEMDISPDGRFAAVEHGPGFDAYREALASLGMAGSAPPSPRRIIILDLVTLKEEGAIAVPPGMESWRMAWSSRPGLGLLKVALRPDGGEASHRLHPWRKGSGFSEPLSLSLSQGGEVLDLFPSPTQGAYLALGQRVEFSDEGKAAFEEWRLMRVTDEGRLAQSQSFARETSGPRGHFWSDDGKTAYLEVVRHGGAEALAKIDLDRLELGLISPLAVTRPAIEFPYDLLKDKEGWKIKGEGGPSAPIAPPGARAILAEDRTRVLVSWQGALFVHDVAAVPLASLAKAAYTQARASAEKQARDVGRALRDYWKSFHMNYPPADKAKSLLSPFLRSLASLEALEISFPGGPLPRGVNTAETPYGWIATPFGRALVMLDGSVVWREGRTP